MAGGTVRSLRRVGPRGKVPYGHCNRCQRLGRRREHGDDMPEVRDWKWPY